MKHLVQKAFLMICLALPVLAMGQYEAKNYGKSADFIALSKRPLAVVLLEEDDKKIERYTKKDQTEDLAVYKSSIQSYNDNIKAVVTKNWRLNKEVEYITAEEAKQLRKSKSKKYAILEPASISDSNEWDSFTALSIPLLQYTRSEKSSVSADIRQSIPSIGKDGFSEAELKLAANMLQRQVDDFIKSGKTLSMRKWSGEVAQLNNCSKLPKYTAFFGEDLFFKRGVASGELKSEYPHPSRILTREEIEAKVLNPDANEAVFVAVPYGIATGPIASMVVWFKVAVEPNTGDIVGGSVPGGMGGTHIVNYFVKKDFKELLNCK